MALQIIQRPKGSGIETPGPLNLPVSFDRKKYAAKWVKEGPAVSAAAEREWIPGTDITADGWQVWRDGDTIADGKPCKVPLQSGVHVLLCRSRVVQDGVNAVCGNIGKERLKQERAGETTGGVPIEDPGLLSDDRIAKVTGAHEQLEPGDVIMNPVPEVEYSRIETPMLKTAFRKKSQE